MASHNVKKIKDCAVVIANDLRTGLTVYLTDEHSWTDELPLAMRLYDDESATNAMSIAHLAEQENTVIGSYLIDATQAGEPTHIREQLRVKGPSIQYIRPQVTRLTGNGA